MTIAPDAPAWWTPRVDPEPAARVIRDVFPGVRSVYFGRATRKWWAITDDRMIEADDLGHLYQRIKNQTPASAARPSAPPPWPRLGPDGRATPRPLPVFDPRPGRLRRLLTRCRHLLGFPDGDEH